MEVKLIKALNKFYLGAKAFTTNAFRSNVRNRLHNVRLITTFAVPYRGVEQLVARWAHNPKVVSSSLTPAT